eukprot:s4778_g2.t1
MRCSYTAMTHIMQQVRTWIQTQDEFMTVLANYDMPMLTIIWADDVAIPWTTTTAPALLPAVQLLVREVDAQFAAHGFTVNYGLQKKNCVMSFQGKHAPALGKEYLLIDCPWCECELTSGRHVLIETKLFYGLGTWRTPTLRQLRYLRTAYIKMLTKLLCLPPDHRSTNAQILQMAGTADVRILLALDRLRYARKLFTDGPDFLQHLAHREYSSASDSWLHGLAADLRWLNSLLPACVPFGDRDEFTDVIDF